MAPFRVFINAVASVITVLDVVETIPTVVLLDHIRNCGCEDDHEVLDKMKRGGLLVHDRADVTLERVITITDKGRALALDIRTLSAKAVNL